MGASEEAGKVAVSAVESLRGTPMVLALVLINIMFLIGGGYVMLELGRISSGHTQVLEDTLRIMITSCVNDNSPMPPINPVR